MTPLVQVIGFGPATLGLPLAADRMGELSSLATHGMTFVDRAFGPGVLRTSRFPFLIESNSPARDFVAGVDPAGRFGEVLDRPAGRKLVEQGERQVPLQHVGEYLADLADEITGWLDGTAGGISYGREVRRVRRNADGTFTSLCTAGRPVLRSHAVVLATGATEDTARHGVPGDRLVPSARLLAGDLDQVGHAVRAGRPVVVVGGSHSGFAAVGLMLARYGGAVRPGQITVVHREIALSFPGVAELAAAGPLAGTPPMKRPVVCRETGAVNRFSGLRGAARQLCLAVLARAEARVRLCPAGTAEARRAIAGAAVVVHSSGYRGTAPEMVEADGTPVPLEREHGCITVGEACRVLGPKGPLAGVYGLGIGFARRDAGSERRVGINVFHGQDAEDIVTSLLTRASTVRPATGPATAPAAPPTTRKGLRHGQSDR
ncbi:FAD/NAD(P)-binding protein [Streptomyces sp. NPDC038707]|uniref:FAD/NAD(P)-binding protein n=1 Tax=Streptomyces sp. NPDC038707 TaxID=3154329 RepID=UPI0033D6664A